MKTNTSTITLLATTSCAMLVTALVVAQQRRHHPSKKIHKAQQQKDSAARVIQQKWQAHRQSQGQQEAVGATHRSILVQQEQSVESTLSTEMTSYSYSAGLASYFFSKQQQDEHKESFVLEDDDDDDDDDKSCPETPTCTPTTMSDDGSVLQSGDGEEPSLDDNRMLFLQDTNKGIVLFPTNDKKQEQDRSTTSLSVVLLLFLMVLVLAGILTGVHMSSMSSTISSRGTLLRDNAASESTTTLFAMQGAAKEPTKAVASAVEWQALPLHFGRNK